jgi:predicted metal-dependent hydrolase
MSASPLKYLGAYSESLQAQVRDLLRDGRVADVLRQRYPGLHGVKTDRALYQYVMDLKGAFMRSSEPVNKVAYDNKLHVISQALGMHTQISRVQGSKLKAKHEIRVAALFRETPEEFLRMIVVHELAHLKVREHDKAFYKLCEHMEPRYHQYEFDLRLYLTHVEAGGASPW